MANSNAGLAVELPSEEIIVEIKPGTVEAGPTDRGIPTAAPPKGDALDVEDLQKKLEESQRNTEELRRVRAAELAEAQRRIAAANQAVDEEAKKREQAVDVGMRAHWERLHEAKYAADAGVAAASNAIESASRDIQAAMEANDSLKMIAAQRSLARAEASLIELERRKEGVDQDIERARQSFSQHSHQARQEAEARERRKQQAEETQQRRSQTPDEWIDQFPGKTREWLRAHKDYVTDASKHREFLDFSKEWAQDYGQQSWHTPPFIAELERRFGDGGASHDDGRDPKPEPATRSASRAPAPRAVAPASRGGSEYYSSTNTSARKVMLPADLAKFVRETNLDPEQYAQGILEDIQAGRKPKEWLDPDFPRFT